MLSRQDFSTCYDNGQRLYSKNFVVFVHKRNTEIEGWRIGLAVGRKIGSAVSRNRVKRVVREFFRLSQEQLSKGYDFVVIPKKHLTVASLTLNSLSKELTPMLQSAKLLHVLLTNTV